MKPQSIDEQFNESYQTKGLQPRGIISEPANDTDTDLGEEYLEAINDNYTTPIRPVSFPRENQITKQYIRSNEEAKSVLGKALDSKAIRLANRSKVVATNTGIYSWAFPVWFFIQLPLALFTLGFIGLAAVADGLLDAANDATFGFAGIVVSFVGGTLSFFDSVAGTDLAGLTDPEAYAIALTYLIFMLGLIKLLAIGLIYQLAFINSLFGRGASVKIITLIIAISGYFFPFLNLFPWFFAWTFVVALYPR